MHPSRLLSEHSRCQAWGEPVARVLAAALQAVDPAQAVQRAVQRDGQRLVIAGQEYNLESIRRIWVVGAGKAGAPMASALDGILSDRIQAGLVSVKQGYAGPQVRDGSAWFGCIEVAEAGHPIPDGRGVANSERISRLLDEAQADDLVICLVSGGGSAVLPAPVPGVSLSDLQALTAALLACGAAIQEINTLRKHLDRLKGGGMARLACPAQLAALILSDVVGDPLEVIASGLTVPDPTTFQDAWQVLERREILDRTPLPILEHLRQGCAGRIPDTPKPDDPAFARVHNRVIASNQHAVRAAMAQAQAEGLEPLLLTTFLQGEARQAGQFLGELARQVAASGEPRRRPCCLVAGGETTVTLRGDGLGGRNQELALGAVRELDGLENVVLAAMATDGGDGPTDAAGALVSGQTLRRARSLGLEADDFLQRNDAYHFFQALGDLLLPGPTQTNVNDLALIFAF